MTTVDVKSLACAEAERLARARRLIAGPPNGSRSLHVDADQRVRPGADTSVGPYIDSGETGPYPNGPRSLHVGADQRVRPGADTSVGPYIDNRETGPYPNGPRSLHVGADQRVRP